MLNLIKTVSKKHVLQPIPTRLNTASLLYNQLSFTFSDQKDLALYQAEAEKRLKSKYSKRHAKRELVEHLYFRDDSAQAIQDEVDDFLNQSEPNQNPESDAASPEASEDFARQLQQLGSTYPNTDSAEYKTNKINIDSREAVSKRIKQIDVNDHLLKFYMKYCGLFGHKQMKELFRKLKENLRNQEVVRQREIEKFNTKVQRMQKISPQIGIKFRHVFLTKEEIGRHGCFQNIIDYNNQKLENNTEQSGQFAIAIDYYQEMMQYRPLKEIMLPDFLERVQRQLNDGNIYLHAMYLSLLNNINSEKSLKTPLKDLHFYARSTCQSLEHKDLASITYVELYMIFNSLKHLRCNYKGDLLFKLEPYILKFLQRFGADTLAEIVIVYLNYGKGSEDLVNMVIAEAMRRLHEIPANILLDLLNALCPHTFLKLDYSINPIEFRQVIFPYVVKHLGAHHYELKRLKQILRYMLENSIGDHNVYELISSEFAKLHKQADFKIFSYIYYALAESGISSNSLYTAFETKLLEFLTAIDTELKEGPVAAIQESSKTSNDTQPPLGVSKEDLTLNSYEQYEAERFSMTLRVLWAYSCFAVKEKKIGSLNLKIWDTGLSALNRIIHRAQSFTGIFTTYSIDMEHLYQINIFTELHAKTAARVNIEDLEKLYLCIFGPHMKKPHLIDQRLFNIEKMYFRKKYRNFITKKHLHKGYPIQFKLENPEIKQSLPFFINEAKDYLRTRNRRTVGPKTTEKSKNIQSQEEDEYIPRGHIFFRRYLLEKLKCAYHEVELPRMYRFLPVLVKDTQQYPSFIEQDVQRFMKLPKNLELEPKDSEQVQHFEKLLNRVRETLVSGQGVNRELKTDYSAWLKQNLLSQYEVRGGSEKVNVIHEEEKEEDAVFSDSEEGDKK